MRIRLIRLTHEVITPDGRITVFVQRRNAVLYYRKMRMKYGRNRVVLWVVKHGRGIYTALRARGRLK